MKTIGTCAYACRMALALFFSVATHAATITWTNTAGGNWSAAANWSPNQVPGTADTALITNSGTYVVTLDTGAVVANLALGGNGGQQTLTTSANSLTLGQAGVVNTNGTLQLSGGGLFGNLTVNGRLNWTGGVLGGAATGVRVATNGLLTLAGVNGTDYALGEGLTNSGTIYLQSGNLEIDWCATNYGTIYNLPGGTVNFEGNVSIDNACGGAGFVNQGSVLQTAGTGISAINSAFDNTGNLDVQIGTLTLTAGGTLGGIQQAEAGGAIDLNGGSFVLGTNCNFSGAGISALSGATLTTTSNLPPNLQFNSGNLIMNMSVPSPGFTVTNANWTVNGTVTNVVLGGGALGGKLTVVGTLTWTNGTLGMSSTGIALETNAALVLAGVNGTDYILGSYLTNAGTIYLQSGNLEIDWCGGNYGALYNLPGGTVNFEGNVSIDNGCGGPGLVNQGTVLKSGGGGATVINSAFNSTGSLDVQSGTVALANGGSQSGLLEEAPGSAIYATNCTINGVETISGLVYLAGTTVDANGSLTVASTGSLYLVSPGNLTLSGPLTNKGSVYWQGGNIQVLNNDTANYAGAIWNASGAQWNIQCSASLSDYVGTGYEIFHNAGLLTKSAGGTTTFTVFLDDAGGTVQAQVGMIQFANGCNLAGNFQATGVGAAIDFTGGTLDWSGTPNFQGNVAITGGTVVINGSTPNLVASGVTISGLDNVTGSAVLTNCTIADAETIVSPVYLAGATVDAGGSLTVAGPGSLYLETAGNLDLYGPLTNKGAVYWQGGNIQVLNNDTVGYAGVIWNASGAQWSIQCSASVSDYFGTGYEIFHNAGLLTKSGVGGTTTFTVFLDNTGGTVQAEVGTISLTSGNYSLGNGTLNFWINTNNNFGSINLPGAAPLTGTVQVTFGPTYVPQIGNSFAFITYGSHTGSFSVLNLPNSVAWTTNYGATSFTLAVANINPVQSFVTWTNPAVITYGTPLTTNQLNAIASVPGSFVYNPPAGTVLSAGSNYLSVVFTPTNTSYNSVNAAVVEVVAKVPLAVTANNSTRTYGEGNPVFTGTLTGVVNGDDITANYTCSAVTVSPPGTYAIVPNLADPGNRLPNYSVAVTNGTLTVTAGAAPTLTAISPTTGLTNGGTAVVLTGTGFELGAGVKVGGNAATSVTVVSGTEITALTPPGSLGPVNVLVNNPDGTSATLANGFNYYGLPPFIQTEPTNLLVIEGSNAVFQVGALYAGGYQWEFNNADLTDSGHISGSHSNLLTILGALLSDAGNYQVVVSSPYGSTNSAIAVLTVLATNPPAISAISAVPSVQGCVITWQTDVPAYDQMVFGTTTSYGSTNVLGTNLVTSHSVTLAGLTPNTLYHYEVLAFDETKSMSPDLTFTTLPDTIPPVANLGSVPSTICSLPYTFTWSGSDNITPATNLLFAYKVDNQGWTAFSSATSQQVSQLADGAHIFSVEAEDAAGNISSPASASFYLETTAPVITEIGNTPADDDCVITWQTLQPTGGGVNYGTNTSYGQNISSAALVTAHSVTLPGLQAGTTYHFQVTAQDACGRQAVSTDTQFNTLAAPDLQVTNVTAPTNVFTGSGFIVSWVDTNSGPGVAIGTWTDAVYLSPTNHLNTNSDLLLGTFAVAGPLNPGQGAPQAQLVTLSQTGVAHGYYYISVLTDVGEMVYEANTTNNAGVSVTNLYVNQTPLPALAVSAVESPNNAQGGAPVTVSWTVCNEGAGATDVPLWYDHLYLSSSTNLTNEVMDYGTYANPGYLVPGDCYEQSATVTLPTDVGGNYYFIVKTDSTGLLAQQTTSNNIAAAADPIDISLVTPGFFHVVSMQVAPTPPTVTWPGSLITYTYIVQNIGQSAITGSWDDRITLSSVSNYVNGVTETYQYENDVTVAGPIAPGASYTNSGQFLLPATAGGLDVVGTWYVLPVEDIHFRAGNGAVGRDELAVPLDVGPPPPADLVVTQVTAPTNAAESQSINVQWSVANQGVNDTSVGLWYDRVYLSTNPVFNLSQSILLGTYAHLGGLPAGSSYGNNASVIIPTNILIAGQSSATNYIFVYTDTGNAVSEATKTNNVLAAPLPLVITPASPADLAVIQVSVPATMVAGTAATISWAVTNQGTGITSVSNWTDTVYLSPGPTLNPATEIVLVDTPHNGFLAPGDYYTNSQLVSLPNCDNGSYYVIVDTDSGQAVDENGVVSNNVLASAAPSVLWPSQAARLTVSAVDAPGSAQAGATLAVSWTVANLGNAATNGTWEDALYLSPTPQLTLETGILLGRYPHATGVGSDQSYVQSQSPVIPPCDSGSYYVVVVTDVGQAVNGLTCYTNDALATAAPIKILPAAYASLQVTAISSPMVVTSGTPWTLQWIVTNAGPSVAGGPWTDAVYLSGATTLDTNALLLGTFTRTNGLASGGIYTQTQSISLPPCFSGNYNVLVVADVSNVVNQTDCLSSNQDLAVASLTVDYGVYPDLVVTGVGNLATGIAGQSFAVSWSVTNTGTATANGPWQDSVYLTTKPLFSPTNSLLLGSYSQTAAIPVNGGYLQSASFTLPNTNGTFYVVVVIDSGGAVQQCQAPGNNVAYSSTTVSLPVTLYPDLKVTSVQVPPTAYAGQNITVSWVVTNEGTEATPTAYWYDALYLSLDQEIEPGVNASGTYVSLHSLAPGQSYTNTAVITIPNGAAGAYYVLGLADATDLLFEHLGYNDSLGFNPNPMLVTLPQPADLVASSAAVSPASGLPGTTATITWQVLNNSANSTPAIWTDAVYLSTNTVWDLTAVEIATANHAVLAANASYTGTWTGPLPALTPGTYHAIVKTDVRDTVNEVTLTNNTVTSTSTINLDVPILTLGQPVTNMLGTGLAQYYKFSAPAGDTVQINLAGSSTNAANEMYVRYGAVPDLGDYDFLYNNPLSADQQIVIPSTETGWYYIMVRGGNEPGGPLAFTLEASIVPLSISSISATKIGDNGQVTLTFNGAKFEPGATVQLVSGTTVYAPATNLLNTGSAITARFLFTNAVDGLYNVVLTNPDGTSVTNLQAVTIEPAIPQTAEVVPGLINSHPRVGLSFDWTGAIYNSGNVDDQYLTVVVATSAGNQINLAAPPQAVQTLNNTTENTLNCSVFLVRDVPVGASEVFSFDISAPNDAGYYYYIIPTVQSTQDFLGQLADDAEQMRELAFTGTNIFYSATTNAQGVVTTSPAPPPAALAPFLSDSNAWENLIAQSYVAAGLLNSNELADLPAATGATLPGGSASRITPKDLAGCVSDANANYNIANNVLGGAALICIAAVAVSCIGATIGYPLCLAAGGALCLAAEALAKYAALATLQVALNACYRDNPPPCSPPPSSSIIVARSVSAKDGDGGGGGSGDGGSAVCFASPGDPNELVGPVSYGPSAFVGVQTPWQYTVYFVNESNASAYAAQITITNTLDPSLNINSFRINQVVMGDITISVPTNRAFVQIRVPAPSPNPTNVVVDVSAGVDVVHNLIFCTMNAVDLNTGQSVILANEGVLPPNTASNIGQGYLVYSILPKAGVPTGTVVTNEASIVFAPNAPITTNPTTNTVDAVPPTSTIDTLAPVQTTTNFLISWSGTDDTNGSGVGSYDIYFNDNSGPWQVFALDETTNSATFDGTPGHTYGFYSIAHDNSGNLEQKTPGAEAVTYISTNQPPVLNPVANQTLKVGTGSLIPTMATNSSGAGQLIYSLLNAPAGASINPTNGAIFWDPSPAQAGTTNLFTIQVANSGIPPLSVTESFLAVVGDYAALDLGSGGVVAGQTVCVPLTLVSSAGLTNLTFTVTYPAAQLGDFSITPVAGQIATLQSTPLDASHAQISVQTSPGTLLVGTQQLASVCFTGLTNAASTTATVLVDFANATEVNGVTPATLDGSTGTLVVLQGRPFLTVSPVGTSQIEITLYGIPGSKYVLESSGSLSGPWTAVNTYIMAGVSLPVTVNVQSSRTMFFRMEEQ